jgi:hypothetical protein
VPRNPIDEIIERRRRERDVAGERYVDLSLDFHIDGQRLLVVGDRWDRRLGDFDGEAQTALIVNLHPGQRRAVEWFAAWLAEHAARRDTPPSMPNLPENDLQAFEVDTEPSHAYAALFAGGRRAGKTWVAVALAIAYAAMFPHAIVWLVSPTDTSDDEMVRYATGFLSTEWIDHDNQDGWWLCNGSQILLKSAFNPEALKQGEVHLVVLNEGQRMQHRAYVLARGAIIDRAGCVIVCANPPVEAKDQQWVADFAAEAQDDLRAAVYFHFNPLENPHINRDALLSMARELDQRTADIELWGMFRASADAVAYNWDRLSNERAAPEEGDCTAMFLSLVEEGDGIKQVVGLDVQRIPYIGGPIYRFFGDPHRDHVLAWIVGEVVLEGGDEVDFCSALYDAELDPAETLIVCDASGQYQHSRRRTADAPPPEWKGRGSFELIRNEGFRRIVPPDRRQRRNPQIQDRVRAFTSMILNSAGVRRLFADPRLAPRSCKAIREWKTVHGAASRTQDVAHLGDGASYPIVRLFPRRILDGLRSPPTSGNPRPVTTGVADPTPRATLAQIGPLQHPPPRGATHGRRGVRGRGM